MQVISDVNILDIRVQATGFIKLLSCEEVFEDSFILQACFTSLGS